MVIGAPKCGTTSLYDYLADHPQVSPPARKELCFFSPFKRFLQRYRVLPSSNWDLYTASFAGAGALRQAQMSLNQAVGRRLLEGDFIHRKRDGGRRRRNALRRAPQSHNCEAEHRLAFEACPFYLGEVEAATTIHAVFPSLRVIAILRNPRERSISAFNDYVRMGRIRSGNATSGGMEALIREKVGLLRSGERTLEDFDMRILTSGVYIHGLEAWGRTWPAAQLHVMRAEDLFADTSGAMARVHAFLGLEQRSKLSWGASNRNTMKSKSKSSPGLDTFLDEFFAPYNAQLYAWARHRGMQLEPWPNASATTTPLNTAAPTPVESIWSKPLREGL